MTPSDALQHIDKWHETPLFDCPRCGVESGKANLQLDLWHCTACDAWGKAHNLAPPMPSKPKEPERGAPPPTPVHRV